MMPWHSRVLLLEFPYRLGWFEHELPPPQPDEVLVKTVFSSISTGTEVAQFTGEDPIAAERPLPRKLGYENVAEVMLCGSRVQEFRPGGYVVGTYGHRDYALVPAHQLIPIPQPSPAALLVILGSDTAKGITKLELALRSPLLVMGAGAVGLLTLFNLTARGYRMVDVVEPELTRLALAQKFGARYGFVPDQLPATAEVYAGGFECSGSSTAFLQLQNQMATGGQICVLSDARLKPLSLSPAFHGKELRICGSSNGLDYRAYARWFFTHAKRYPMEEIFDAQTPFAKLPETLAAMAEGRMRPRKVLVLYDR
jgi:alcohol dehydrogenase